MRVSPNSLRAACSLLLVFFASSCGFNNSIVSLDYRPTGRLSSGPRVVGAGRFADLRYQGDYNLGTVHSPIGTTMETLTTHVPVENIVRNGFARGLAARHMLAPLNEAPYLVTGEIQRMAVNQYLHPTASVRMRVSLVHAEDGHIVFSKVFESYREGEAYMPGSGSPVPAMNELMSRALQDVIDQVLDNRGFRSRLGRAELPDAPKHY